MLPDAYPIAQTTIDAVLAEENYLGLMFDHGVIGPRPDLLYQFAVDDLDKPRVFAAVRR